MSDVILIPVKSPERAKQRLAEVLTPSQRSAMVLAMFKDVCRAVAGLGVPVAVVTDCAPIQQQVRSAGWRTIDETTQVSESASVDRASSILAGEGAARVLRLPADIPLIEGTDVVNLLAWKTRPPCALLVPSRDGTGTNAVLRSPADLFPSRFGAGSLLLHLQEARRAGAQVEVLRNERIAFDLDDPSDLRDFLRVPSDTFTRAALSDMGLVPATGSTR